MAGSSFQFIFHGEGYTDERNPCQEKPNAKIRTRVQGPGDRCRKLWYNSELKKRD